MISAHSDSDFRCSHEPPAPDQITHVWLDSAKFSAYEVIEDSIKPNRLSILNTMQDIHENQTSGKTKRDVFVKKDYLELDSITPELNRSKLSDKLNVIDKLDLVPIRIQVYYDDSVYSLQQQKLDLITNLVIPSVIKFFESILSMRREYAIDKFRISRRCPNNTLYYARDFVGISRPYCMERCEDYAVCGEMYVPPAHLSACSYCNSTSMKCLTNYASEGTGVANTQLLLYVSAKNTARCRKDQTIAYAAHCAQDAKTDRPVAGHANLCPSSISTDFKDLKTLIATVKHELTHVLGFSVSLFAYYRDELGRPLTERESALSSIPVDPATGYAKWSEKIIKKLIRRDWLTGGGKIEKEVHLMVTPTVVREVRSHFNCSSLEGAELEDQGSDGTSMTHWEKRIFENEAMTGTHTQNSIYSRITLAALQDTGWYIANFSRAENLEWGRNLGCDFAKKSCKSWIDERRSQGRSIRPFCDRVKGDLLQIACTEDRTSKAVCNMKQYKKPLDLAYQNFDHLDSVTQEDLPLYGGSVDLADYCPFIQEFTWQSQNVTLRGSRCDIGGNSLDLERNAALEHYGTQTRCFEHGRRWEQRSCIYKRHWHHYGAGCYKYTCSNGHVNIHVGNNTYPCYFPDQILLIEQMVDRWLYNGTLICPPCEKICSAHKCLSYDKRIIEKISGIIPELRNLKVDPKETLMSLLENDRLPNSNELTKESAYNLKTNMRQKVFELESYRTLADLKPKDQKKYLNLLLDLYNVPQRQKLTCSGASGVSRYSCIPTSGFLFMMAVSLIALQRTMSTTRLIS